MADETFWWAETFVHLETGIGSAEVFGLPQLTFGAVEVSPLGIATGEAFGATVVIGPPQFVYPAGIESAEAFGQHATGSAVIPVGIESAEAVGVPMLGPTIHALGIESGEAFGEAVFINPAKPEVVGFNISSGTTTTMPAHEPGDILLVMAYNDGPTNPGTPSASGSVPAWVNINNGNGNTNAMRLAYFVATSDSHTTGTWSNSTAVAVAVLRGADQYSPIGYNSLGFSTASNQSVAPALENLFDKSGRSQLVYIHAHKTVTSWGTPPSGFTRLGQVNTDLAVNTKDDTTTDGAATQSATTSSSTGYAGAILEVRQSPLPGVTWTRTWAGNGTADGSQTQWYAEGDRIVLFMVQDRAVSFTATVDGTPLKRVALVQFTGIGGVAMLATYISEPLSEGNHTLEWDVGAWTAISALQVTNAHGVCGIPKTLVDTGNGYHPVDAPKCAGGRIFHAFGCGNNPGFGNPTGGNWRWVTNSNSSIAVSDWDDATVFAVTKSSSSPQWAGLSIDFGPLESMDENAIGPRWENPPQVVDFGASGGSLEGTAEAIEGDTLVFDFIIDRGTTTPPTILMNGTPMPVAHYVNFTGAASNAMMVRYIVENVPGGTLEFASSGGNFTFGAWWTAQASFVRCNEVGATTSVFGTGAPSQGVTLDPGEFALQAFGGLNDLNRCRGGLQINYTNDGACITTQVADESTTFTCPSSQNHAGMVTKFN
ncbi:minor tail protein [Mycobacterium phage Azrael100]|nr:minor tail protein [Mycobacterium phage Azrael100]